MIKRYFRGRFAVVLLVPIALALLGMVGCGSDADPTEEPLSGFLYIYNWEEYFALDTLENFEKEFGVKVILSIFPSEETMLGAVLSDLAKFDLVVSSGSTIGALREQNLLAQIDFEMVSNIGNIDEAYRGLAFDPEGKYSVPYLWGSTGIAINGAFVNEDEVSWGIFWNSAYKEHIALLSDPQEFFVAALKSLGYSGNSSDEGEIRQAGDKLFELSSLNVQLLDPASIMDGLASGDIWVGQTYNGDDLFAIEENEDVVYVVPKEGAMLWVDSFVIPRDARNKRNAEAFINYILRPDVITGITEYLY